MTSPARTLPALLGAVSTVLAVTVLSAIAVPGTAAALPPPPCRDRPGLQCPVPRPGPPAPPMTPAPTATFTWSLPRSAPGVEPPDASARGTLALNACGSGVGPSGLAGYTWTIRDVATGRQTVRTSSSCLTDVADRPYNGHWQVTLTVAARNGSSATQSQDLPFRDALVVQLGDSAASGEGNPDHTGAIHFSDQRCDRSTLAAADLAVGRAGAAMGPHGTVTLWNLACSGASILRNGDGREEGGLLTPYHGQHPVRPALPPQVDQLKQLLTTSGRTADDVIVTAGANDTGWADMLQTCYVANKIGPQACEAFWGPRIAANLRSLHSRFAQLAGTLAPIVPPGRTWLTEYWDPTHDDRTGTTDPRTGPGYSWWCPRDVLAPDAVDRAWGYEHAVVPLNTAVRRAALDNGFHLVGGIERAFHDHGLCATDSWVVSPTESLQNQGDLNGSWHANAKGQSYIADVLVRDGAVPSSLRTSPPPPPPPPSGAR